MSDKKVNVVFTLQNTQFNKNINDMNRQIRLCEQQVRTAGQQMLVYGEKTQALAEKQRALSVAIKSAETNINNYRKRISNLQTTMQQNITKTEQLKVKKQALTKEYKESVKTLGEEDEKTKELKRKLQDVTEQYKEYSNRVKSNADAINKSTTAMESQKTKLNSLKAQYQQVNRSILENSNNLLIWSNRLKTASDKITTFGRGADSLGNTLLKLSAPILAFSAYSIKTGIGFEASMSKVQATAGSTAQELDILSETAKRLGKEIKGASAQDVADSYQYLALAGQDTNTMLKTIEPNVKASIAFGQDMATSTDQVTDSMSALGIKASETNHYLDVLAKTQNRSNTTADLLEQAYIECGATLSQMNVPLEESATILGGMANQGLKGSQAGNSLNSVFINLLGTTSRTSEALKAVGVQTFDSAGKFRGLETVLSDIKVALANATDEQKANIQAALGGKTQMSALQAMLNVTGDTYNTLHDQIVNCDGALETMYKTMTDNTKGSWTEMKDQAESIGLKIADGLLPVCNELIDKVKELMDWWDDLSPVSKNLIIDLGLMTAATGGLLKVVGKVSTGLGSLSGTLSKIIGHFGRAQVASAATANAVEGVAVATEGATAGAIGLSSVVAPLIAIMGTLALGVYSYAKYQDVCNQSVTKSRESMSLSEKAVAKLTGTVSYSQKQLENWNIVAKKLPNTLSGSFKKAFQKAKEDIADFNLEIAKINFDNVLDSNEANKLQTRIDKVIDNANKTINSHYAEIQASLQQTFTMDGVVDSGEQKLIDYYNRQKDKSLSKVSENQKAINDLMHKMTQEGYQLTSEDITAIEKYYAEIKQEELKAKTKSREDVQYAQGDYLNSNSSSMTSKQATKELSKLKKNTNETNKSLEDEMNSSVNNILQGYSRMNDAEKKQAQKSVTEIKDYYNKKIKENNDYYIKTYSAVISGNEKLSKVIDIYTGKNFDKRSATLNKEFNSTKNHYDNLDSITSSGWTKIYNKSTKTWDNCYVKYDETCQQIVGLFDSNTSEVIGYNEKQKDSIEKLANDYMLNGNKIKKSNEEMAISSINNKGKVVNANGEVGSSLYGVKEKADGTKTALANINGKTYKINIDANGAIKSCDEVEKKKIHDKEFKIKAFLTVEKVLKAITGIGFAEGGTVNKSGIYNYNARGIELADSVTSNGYSTYQQAYLPSYTQVTNALMTTAKLKEMVNAETKIQNKELYNAITVLISAMEKDNNSNKGVNINMYNPRFDNKGSENANKNNVKRIIKSIF